MITNTDAGVALGGSFGGKSVDSFWAVRGDHGSSLKDLLFGVAFW